MRLHISPDEIETVFAPFVVKRYAPDDPEWLATLERVARKERKRRQRRERGLEPTRDRALVEQEYAGIWRRSLADEVLNSKATPFEWSRGHYLAHSIGRKRVHQLLLVRTLEALQPRSAIEVGCGNALNLLLLASLFPEIRFTGLELTAEGIDAAAGLVGGDRLPSELESISVGPLKDVDSYRRIRLCRASAAHLPFRDNAADVVFTVLALEQMESIRAAALGELRRVARRHVVMIEPFHDWNAGGHRRDYIEGNEYFDAKLDELEHFGLTPVAVVADIPNKIAFRAGLVVARVD